MMRPHFEKHGAPQPVGEGLYLFLPVPHTRPPVLVEVMDQGSMRVTGGGRYIEPILPGLYIPLTKALAALDVAEAVTNGDGLGDYAGYDIALAAYRNHP